ncbi:preprotein translocase subunit SecG [Candidatus Peregrinibacteria bacterium CG10_big_fil_rev_8_21_14_0_10_55_24]|nr:MAG: preprotein translocase subunit SecG [Candidatus Peregrinibacteria bacterium CG10_big_fil_rev_8_21_14_0_10_55_24]
MVKFLTIAEVIISILLTLSILLQHRASGLSATFGGSGATFIQRRGAERVIFRASIWMGVLFFLIPVLLWFIA